MNHLAQYSLKANVTLLTSDYQVHKLAMDAKIQSIPLINFLK
jgi:hypothetical protein